MKTVSEVFNTRLWSICHNLVFIPIGLSFQFIDSLKHNSEMLQGYTNFFPVHEKNCPTLTENCRPIAIINNFAEVFEIYL